MVCGRERERVSWSLEGEEIDLPKQTVHTNLDACNQKKTTKTLFGGEKLEILLNQSSRKEELSSLDLKRDPKTKKPYPNHKINGKYEILEHISVGLNFVIDEHF